MTLVDHQIYPISCQYTNVFGPENVVCLLLCCILFFNARLQCNDRAMIRLIWSIKPVDVASVVSSELLAKLELDDLNLILRERASLVWAC